jgi:hypothetical protein
LEATDGTDPEDFVRGQLGVYFESVLNGVLHGHR